MHGQYRDRSDPHKFSVLLTIITCHPELSDPHENKCLFFSTPKVFENLAQGGCSVAAVTLGKLSPSFIALKARESVKT